MPSSTYRALALALASCSSEAELAPPAGSGSGTHIVAKPGVVGAEEAAGGEGRANGTAGTAGAVGTAGTSGDLAAPAGCKPNRAVLTGEMSNARDLGGTPLGNGTTVACGVIFRGPPLRLTEDGCAEAANLELRTLLDLRIEGERTSVPDAACVQAERVFAPLPVPYGLGPTDYLNDLNETSSIAIAFHAFGNPDAYPIYFHCTFGRDRTGVVGALVLMALGATRTTVMDEYLLSRPNVGAYPDSLTAVLDEIERRGGADNVLRDAGISNAELAILRQKAIAIE